MRHTQQLPGTTERKQQPSRGFDTYSLLACLAISAFLILWITFAGGSFNLRSAFFLLVLPWFLLRAGGIISSRHTIAILLRTRLSVRCCRGVHRGSGLEGLRAIIALGHVDCSSDRNCRRFQSFYLSKSVTRFPV